MKEYIIKKGKHTSGLHFGVIFSNKMRCQAMFDVSCLYDLKSNDKYDINKLFGFSDTLDHHKQSARIGWRCVDGKFIEIVTYTYSSGERLPEKRLGVVLPGDKFVCSIEDKKNQYVYRFKKGNEPMITVKEPKTPDWFLFHYQLYPYFGGNVPAPHTMKIFLRKL